MEGNELSMSWLFLCIHYVQTIVHKVIKIPAFFFSTSFYLNVIQGVSFLCFCMTTLPGPKALLLDLNVR